MKAKDIVDKTVVLTGKFKEVKRAEAEAALARLGATIGSSVNKKTTILFVGERAGSKLAKAKSLGVEVADEATLVALLKAAPEPSKAKPKPKSKPTPSTGQGQVEAFAGKVIALTGTFTTMKRSAAKKILTEAGASVGSGVTKKTQLLIYGDNAGSKLDAADKYGVTLMTEAEMVVLLTADGGGAGELAGASDKLAKKMAETAANVTEVGKAVAELKEFVRALKKRKDIKVSIAKLGRKTGKSKLAGLERLAMPRELIDLYAEMDGAHVEWDFIEPSGGGRLRIPEVSQWTRFGGEDDHYMGFDEGEEALLLDEITPEGGTWLVREAKARKPEDDDRGASIIFASAAEGAEGVIAASSLAEYLRSTMKNGFVGYWPRCFSSGGNVSYAEFEAAITRFQAPPVTPSKIRAGMRVHVSFFSEGGRGEVLDLHEAPESSLTNYTGTKFAKIQLDEGSVFYAPAKWMKTTKKVDAYQRMRDPSFDFSAASKADLVALLDDIARAINPLSCFVNGRPGNARLAAGLLATRSLSEGIAAVLDICDAIDAVELEGPLIFEKNGDEFTPTEASRMGYRYHPSGLMNGLLGGLDILAHRESARREIPASQLLPKALRKRLASNELSDESAKSLVTDESPLRPPDWAHGEAGDLKNLGLPPDASVLLSSC